MDNNEDLNNIENDETIEITPELLKEIIDHYVSSGYTISELIERTKEEDEFAKKSFDASFSNLKLVNLGRKDMISFLRSYKLRIQLNMLLYYILFGSKDDLNQETIGLINETSNKLTSEKSLLKEIKDNLNTLKKYKLVEPLVGLNVLLKLINTKNELLISVLKDELNAYLFALKGYSYIPPTKNQEELDKTNNEIDDCIKQLGLNNN